MSASAESTSIPGIPGSAWVLCATCEKQRLRAQCRHSFGGWECRNCSHKEEVAEYTERTAVPAELPKRSGWQVLQTVTRAPVQELPTVRPELPVGSHADTTAHMESYATLRNAYRLDIRRGRVDPKAPGEVGRLVRDGMTLARAKRLVKWAIQEEIGVKP